MRKSYTFMPKGVCSMNMKFEIEDGKIHNFDFYGGCNGNLQAVGRLIEGKDVQWVIGKLSGLRCGGKPTSCGDQLASALKRVLAGEDLND